MPNESAAKPTWAQTFSVYKEPATLRMFSLGFGAGLPFLLVFGSLSFWLREAGVDRATIGYLSWIGLAYGFKWAWAPLVDRLPLPFFTKALGRRRSWLLLAQLVIVSGLVSMATTDPKLSLMPMVWSAIVVAFGSATQDIALDAYRIEAADLKRQPALAAAYQTGYRLAMIWAGAGVLWLAARAEVSDAQSYQFESWRFAYLIMAASMSVGIVTVLFSAEPINRPLKPVHGAGEWLKTTLVEPFADFFRRYGMLALVLLLLIGTYRISDVVMGVMANPFYVDMGYSKDEVATISKVYGVIMTLVGSFVGGALAMRLGIKHVLVLGALLSALSNVLFAWLGSQGHDLNALTWVISADNISSGIAQAAFVAYLSSLTNVEYSATQYAIFTSIMLLIPKSIAGFSGKIVDLYGYSAFFTSTALLGVPVLILIWAAGRMEKTAASVRDGDTLADN